MVLPWYKLMSFNKEIPLSKFVLLTRDTMRATKTCRRRISTEWMDSVLTAVNFGTLTGMATARTVQGPLAR